MRKDILFMHNFDNTPYIIMVVALIMFIFIYTGAIL